MKRHDDLKPLSHINGYDVKPGFYNINGATVMNNGVNFTIHSKQATSCELLLFKSNEKEPFVTIPIPNHYKIGSVYSIFVFDLDIYEVEYAYRLDGPMIPEKGIVFNKNKVILDPYAKAVAGQSKWGKKMKKNEFYTGKIVKDNFNWGEDTHPLIPFEDLIIYETHVRGFTMDDHSPVQDAVKGTFAGIKEMIPYLKDLGINAIELMPIFEFDEMCDMREYNGNKLYNYWGYNTVCFFAPNSSYASTEEFNQEGTELKELIKELHLNGIEVILDVVFNHTAEGDQKGQYISFKGLDNNIYYMLTPDKQYYNFSGCGNTLNCNHPIVQQLIIDCLRHWTIEYHIDGFRFDLASILGRNENGAPMDNPPLLQRIAFDPILANVKLIAEAWDAGGMYQVGSFPSWGRWTEWNGKYRDDVKKFLRGDEHQAYNVSQRITGSLDMYNPEARKNASINFITCHDGFTLYDLYSYNNKHNEANGWDNNDGANDNYSWNCGYEGETDNEEINKLRKKLIKNAIVTLMCSRGIPMILAGDEFCNTQFGNNNAYCQDNPVGWINWDRKEKFEDIFELFKFIINFRNENKVLRKDLEYQFSNLPAISIHGCFPWNPDYSGHSHYLGIMFAGSENEKNEVIYLAINTYWEDLDIKLPTLSDEYGFTKIIDTNLENSIINNDEIIKNTKIAARSINLFVLKRK